VRAAVLLATVMIPSTHRLRCCLLLACSQAQTRLGGEPLTLGHRGRHSYGSQGRAAGRGKADTRAMLLRPASNHRILLCSPNTAPPRGPARRFQQHSQAHMTPVYPCKVPTTRGDSGAPTGQRGTRGGTHTGADRASRRPETMVSPM
ncbi:Hypothetical protein GSB_155442, partial [Giardia duodenalis]